MSIKVYLAGGFYQEDDWRYSMVKGLREVGSNLPDQEKWPILPDSIFDCLDFIGPYPEDFAIRRHRFAIQDADVIFLWFTNEYTDDIPKICFELGYAGALKKEIGYGCKTESEDFETIRFALCGASVFTPEPHLADTPTDSLRTFLSEEIEYLPIEWLIKLKKYGHTARKICGQQIDKAGYVYVIRADTGHYKIGRTNNVPNRIRLFTIKLPFDFDIVNYFPCRDMFEAESSLHTLFTDYRVNGEWFNLPQDCVNLLKSVSEASDGLFRDGSGKTIEGLYVETGLCWYLDEEGKLISR